jgi:hypothetical protein
MKRNKVHAVHGVALSIHYARERFTYHARERFSRGKYIQKLRELRELRDGTCGQHNFGSLLEIARRLYVGHLAVDELNSFLNLVFEQICGLQLIDSTIRISRLRVEFYGR